MATKKGVTAIWFLDQITLGTTAATSSTNAFLSATGTFNFQSVTVNRTADRAEVRNNIGDVTGEVFYNEKLEGTFNGIPTGTSGATAATVNILPAPGSVILLTDTVDNYIGTGGSYAGDWIVDSAEASGGNDNARNISIKVHRYSTATVSRDATA